MFLARDFISQWTDDIDSQCQRTKSRYMNIDFLITETFNSALVNRNSDLWLTSIGIGYPAAPKTPVLGITV